MVKSFAFYWFMTIFLAAVVTIGLPTKTITVWKDNPFYADHTLLSSSFHAEVFTLYPNYHIGLGIIAFMALIGALLSTEFTSRFWKRNKPRLFGVGNEVTLKLKNHLGDTYGKEE